MTHKLYKKRFLYAEEVQRSQWGVVDAFVRNGRREEHYGFILPDHHDYKSFRYAELRRWA